MKPYKTFCVFSLLTAPYVSSFQAVPCIFSLHASALGLISYSGFSAAPVAPGFADFFS